MLHVNSTGTPQPEPVPTQAGSAAAASATMAGTMTQDLAAAANAANAGQAQQPHQTNIGTPVPMTMARMVQRMHQSVSLSPEGMDYFDKIRTAFTAPHLPPDLPVTVNQLATPSGAMALSCRGYVILLIPSESLANLDPNVPRTVVAKRATQCYLSTVATSGNYHLLQSLIVTPQDYTKVQVMITCLQNTFYAAINPEYQNIDIDSLSEDFYVVNTNNNDVEAFFKTNYPHATIPRNNYGFVLSIQPKERYYSQMYGNHKPLGYFEQGNTDLVPVAGVTAFTDIVRSTNTVMGIPKFGTAVRITGMHSLIPTFRMSAMLLPLAADVFMRAGLWKHQFSFYGAEEPNLGTLWKDIQTNTYMRVTTPDQRNIAIDNYLEAPSLVLDVQEGTFRIPGIHRYADTNPAVAQSIIDDYSAFLKNKIMNGIVCSKFYLHEYTGVIMRNGGPIDSRWADYLTTMVNWSSDANTVSCLLDRTSEPKNRVELIRKFYPTLEIIYSNFLTIVDSSFLAHVTSALASRIKLSQNQALGISNNMDFSFLVQNGINYKQNNLGATTFTYGGGGHTFGNPFAGDTIYR